METTQAKIYIFGTKIKIIFCYIVDVHDLVGTLYLANPIFGN